MKKNYHAWATNESGATIEVGKYSSIAVAAAAARATLGRGWKVVISDEDVVVKSFTIKNQCK